MDRDEGASGAEDAKPSAAAAGEPGFTPSVPGGSAQVAAAVSPHYTPQTTLPTAMRTGARYVWERGRGVWGGRSAGARVVAAAAAKLAGQCPRMGNKLNRRLQAAPSRGGAARMRAKGRDGACCTYCMYWRAQAATASGR